MAIGRLLEQRHILLDTQRDVVQGSRLMQVEPGSLQAAVVWPAYVPSPNGC